MATVDLRDHAPESSAFGGRLANVQQAINACNGGDTLYIPEGMWMVNAVGALTECLLWEKPLRIVGEGQSKSIISVFGGVGASTDILRLDPAVTGEEEWGWTLEGIRLKADTGTPGRDAIVIDLDDSPSEFLAKLRVSDVWAGPFGRRAFSMDKAGADINGWFTSLIENFRFDGGPSSDRVVSLNRSGDSLKLVNGTITGGGMGIWTSPVAGAAQQVFEDINNTAAGGMLHVIGGQQVKVRGGQYEAVSYDGADDAAIVLENTNGCTIEGINLNVHGNCSAVRFKGTSSRNQVVGGCEITGVDAVGGDAHFVYDATAGALNDNGAGDNHYQTLAGGIVVKPVVIDSSAASVLQTSVGKKLGGLLNSWLDGDAAGFGLGAFVIRHRDETASWYGQLRDGTIAVGTDISQSVPVWARPSVNQKVVCGALAGTWGTGLIQFTSAGVLEVQQLPGATTDISLDGIRYPLYP